MKNQDTKWMNQLISNTFKIRTMSKENVIWTVTFVKVPLICSAASFPKSIASFTVETPNCTMTESVSPYIT